MYSLDDLAHGELVPVISLVLFIMFLYGVVYVLIKAFVPKPDKEDLSKKEFELYYAEWVSMVHAVVGFVLGKISAKFDQDCFQYCRQECNLIRRQTYCRE
jgi:hypothetical protein